MSGKSESDSDSLHNAGTGRITRSQFPASADETKVDKSSGYFLNCLVCMSRAESALLHVNYMLTIINKFEKRKFRLNAHAQSGLYLCFFKYFL